MYPEATQAIVGMMQLRRTLQPLLHDLLWRHHADYEPVTRPLWLDFPDDPRAWEDGDAYLLGPDLLVAPALDQGVETVRAYLPAGTAWRDIRDDRVYAGGAEYDLAAPPHGLPPMLVREGSGLFIDLAPTGFAASAPLPGVLLYPPEKTGRMTWSGFDESDAAPRDPAAPQGWTLEVDADADTLAISTGWRGATPPPADALRIVLSRTETRRITLNGAAATLQPMQALGIERLALTWVV
jgi:alpha-glucosidase